MDLDRETANRIDASLPVPQNTFKPSLFRQPSLAEGPIRPKAYRSRVGSKSSSSSSKAHTPGADAFLPYPHHYHYRHCDRYNDLPIPLQ